MSATKSRFVYALPTPDLQCTLLNICMSGSKSFTKNALCFQVFYYWLLTKLLKCKSLFWVKPLSALPESSFQPLSSEVFSIFRESPFGHRNGMDDVVIPWVAWCKLICSYLLSLMNAATCLLNALLLDLLPSMSCAEHTSLCIISSVEAFCMSSIDHGGQCRLWYLGAIILTRACLESSLRPSSIAWYRQLFDCVKGMSGEGT